MGGDWQMIFCEPGSVATCDRDVALVLALLLIGAAVGAALRRLMM